VTARIGLDHDTKTVKGGALFCQEFLPTESLFYAVLIVNAARTKGVQKSAAALLADMTTALTAIPNGVLQIGGDETTGKGFCSVRLTTGGAK
jgi:CRISPR-associated protein Cmr4